MAREPSIERLREVAAAHKPRGWRLSPTGIHPKDADGLKTIAYVDWEKRLLVHPEIVDRASLSVYLHECGHVHYKHEKDHADHGVETEWEAEQYAWSALRAADIPVPRLLMAGLRRYLKNIMEHVYAAPGAKDSAYADCCAEVPDHIMRFVYGPKWRHSKPGRTR